MFCSGRFPMNPPPIHISLSGTFVPQMAPTFTFITLHRSLIQSEGAWEVVAGPLVFVLGSSFCGEVFLVFFFSFSFLAVADFTVA